jgi:NADPH-dependent glutamate synthase beta subunit-like oxidoreductase
VYLSIPTRISKNTSTNPVKQDTENPNKRLVPENMAKRVAVIGLGPAGAITIDALAQEKAFDTIRVFERNEAPGGCW